MRKKKLDVKVGNTPVDLTALKIDDDDCFGKEWDNSHKTCVRCSAYDICMVVTLSKGTAKKAAKIKKDTKHFFDELDWSAVPWFEIYETVLLNPGKLQYDKLFALVKEESKVIDDVTAHAYIKNWLIENNIKIKDGCLYLF